MSEHAKQWKMLTEKRKYAHRHHSQFAHIRAYAIRPHSWRRKTFTNRCHPSPHPQRINGKYVGAYRIRPSHKRTRQKIGMFTEKQWYARRHHSPFAHIRAYAIRPHSWRQKLTRNDTSHHRIPQRTNSKYVGAYRIRPPQRRTRQEIGMFTEKQWYARHHHFLFDHVRAYAIRPYSWRRKTFTNRCHPSPHLQRTNSKYVGAYRIRPPHKRTRQKKGISRKNESMLTAIISLFVHIRAYAIRPYS